MTNNEIIATMSRCVCGTRIQWTQNLDNSTHRGVVDEFYPQNGAEDAYLAVIEPGRYIPVSWCQRNTKNIDFGGQPS